jgi:hypothetical protein
MRDDKRKIVSEVRKMYLEEVSNLRKKRDKDLYDLCLELGGHDFWDWQRELQTCVNPELNRFIEKRICSCCWFREEREIEEEVNLGKCCCKEVSGCYCKMGWPYDKQCSDCRDDWPEGTFRDSYCICKPAEEIKPTPTPVWLEKQLDIVENTVSQWSEEKQKRFANINSEENRKEIYEFAMKRSDETERLREGTECHVARPGEGTYECDIKNPCPACRLRELEKLERERKKIKENADIERKEEEEKIRASTSKSLKSLR